MRKKLFAATATAALSTLLMASPALADFTPEFEMQLSTMKVKEHPTVDIHLEFDENDEEIGNFLMTLPKGVVIAGDEDIEDFRRFPDIPGVTPNGEDIGGGEITIRAGIDCRPGPEGQIPVGTMVTVTAEIYERSRTDEEADAGIHAVWFLDLEPLNRVRLLVSGSPKTGWKVEGAPTPSDNTCNPLTVDLQILGETDDGIPVITNPPKPGKKIFTATISSQDSPSTATFKQAFKFVK